MNKLRKLVADFVEYCEVDRGLSPRTAEKYDYRMQRFMQWARSHLRKKDLALDDLDMGLIRKFRQHLSRQELKDSTQYNYMVTIRSFLKFLAKQDYKTVAPEKIELSKYNPSHSIKFLKAEQLDKLMVMPDTTKASGLRDRAILELLFSTGLRVSELASLDRKQVDLKSREFSVIGKGGRRRVVFVSESAVGWLRKYLNKRDDKYVPLFLHYAGPGSQKHENKKTQEHESKKSKNQEIKESRNQPSRNPTSHIKISGSTHTDLDDPDGERFRLSVRSIQRLVKKYVRAAGLNVEATPHTLRHSLATDLLGAGADLRSIQEILGHKNVSTTQIYTHVTNVQLKETHRKFHGKWRGKEVEN